MAQKNKGKKLLTVPPRIMIAAPHGRSGKTLITIGVCRAFSQRGLKVQPFKKGPDYIDPSWLSAASGRRCRNLDAFLMSRDTLLGSFETVSQGMDLAVIEGNMGLYDGIDREGKGSSADLARMIRTPVILVVDTARMTRSVAAIVMGYQHFEPDTPIAGVILNNVSGERHRKKLTDAVETCCEIPVLGAVPRSRDLNILERNLGLVPFRETGEGIPVINRIGEAMEEHLHMEKILDVAKKAPEYLVEARRNEKRPESSVSIGVMYDQAFHFYYPENLEALERAGSRLVLIDSLTDRRLPRIDGLYIGGGFPELYVEDLAHNRGLMAEIAQRVEEGLPVYAECGGLMCLSEQIRIKDKSYPMVGIIPGEIELCTKPQGHGYVQGIVEGVNPFFPVGTTISGHEFHHSRLHLNTRLPSALRIQRGHGIDGSTDALIYKNVWASYVHIHALGTPEWAPSFISLAAEFKKQKVSRVHGTTERRNYGGLSGV